MACGGETATLLLACDAAAVRVGIYRHVVCRNRKRVVSNCRRVQPLTRVAYAGWQAALTTFDDTGSNEMDIELVTQEVTRLFRKCEAQLQRFGEQRSSSEADEKVRAWPLGSATCCGSH